ncbi:MAG: class I SAM-dependent methyltransferase [Acholeplasmataceae bacterium]
MKKTLINELKNHSLTSNIPIIQDEALNYIKDLINQNNYQSILEIGTAYGYSAISFSNEKTVIDTIEKDPFRAIEASKWISQTNYKINVINEDALTYQISNKKYDLIFIDGPKAQYEKLFSKYEKNLTEDGIIICDNLNFHHLKIDEVKNRGTKRLLKKLNEFKLFLINNPSFQTKFLNVGDGLSISKRIFK